MEMALSDGRGLMKSGLYSKALAQIMTVGFLAPKLELELWSTGSANHLPKGCQLLQVRPSRQREETPRKGQILQHLAVRRRGAEQRRRRAVPGRPGPLRLRLRVAFL